jgi:hypothetical protein
MTSRFSTAGRSPTSTRAFHYALPLLPAVLVVLLACSGHQSAAPAAAARAAAASPSPSPASPPARRPDPQLSAEIGFNDAQSVFRIENRDAFNWSNCQFVLKTHGATPGYTLGVAGVKSGFKETAMLRAGDFTDAAGRKFDVAAGRVATLDFSCDTPQGRLHGSQFLLGEPPAQGRPQ